MKEIKWTILEIWGVNEKPQGYWITKDDSKNVYRVKRTSTYSQAVEFLEDNKIHNWEERCFYL